MGIEQKMKDALVRMEEALSNRGLTETQKQALEESKACLEKAIAKIAGMDL